MNIAASYYLKAGFENFSDYATSTQRLFESYVFMDQARRETDPEKQAKYYLMAEKVLQMSADRFAKAKYTEKANQVQRLLRKVKEDKELAISLNEVFHAPVVTSSTASFSTLSLSEEKAVGLERLAQMDVLAKLIVQESDAAVGQDKTLNIQIVNIGKVLVWLTKIEDIAPMGSQLITGPDYSCVENRNLIFRGRQLSPMKMEEIEIVLRPVKKGALVIKPRITYVNETGRQSFHYPESVRLNISEMVLPNRVATGYSELDNLLLGGIPEHYSVLLMSSSSDERQLLVNKFVETGAKENQLTFYVTANADYAKSLAVEYPSNFYLFLCNPRADAMIKDFHNIFKLSGMENLTNIDIALAKGLSMIDASSNSVKRACIEIVSDILLLHQAAITQKWLSQLLAELRAKGFTTLAVLNPQMHSKEEVQAILEHFEGEIQIREKEIEKGPAQFLRVRKLLNKKYLDAELLLTKET
jgi:KaiC/GvpD/RAD55 family RecA-like ATPase